MATQDTDEGYEGKPGWFSLIASAAAPQSLLPFRYIEGLILNI
jgi:hypothetical protein